MVNGIVGMGARAPQVVVVRENEKKKSFTKCLLDKSLKMWYNIIRG